MMCEFTQFLFNSVLYFWEGWVLGRGAQIDCVDERGVTLLSMCECEVGRVATVQLMPTS